jgi:hypothetical protein
LIGVIEIGVFETLIFTGVDFGDLDQVEIKIEMGDGVKLWLQKYRFFLLSGPRRLGGKGKCLSWRRLTFARWCRLDWWGISNWLLI